MLHLIITGILLGYGAAIPIGPLNLEITRRNLRLGTRYGIALGLGACSADITYLILLSLGALAILTHPVTLKIVSILGAFILIWFGINALRMKTLSNDSVSKKNQPKTKSALRHSTEGYLLTLINPYTILFWSSISSQIASITARNTNATLLTGLGVMLGTVSWVIFLNSFLHFTRHKLSMQTMICLNRVGGIILLGFAAYGFYYALA